MDKCIFKSLTISKLTGGRLEYIDMLRGITMLLVIYSHLCYKLFDDFAPESRINNVFVTFRMPLFFFISGFFMCTDRMDFNLYGKRLLNRFIIQLYPTLIILALYCFITSSSYVASLFDPFKNGYWFTFVSVEMYIIVGLLILLLNQVHTSRLLKSKTLLIVAAVSVVACVLLRKLVIYESVPVLDVLSIDHLSHFIPYLCFGCIFKLYYKDFLDKYMTAYWLMAAIIVFALSILFPKYSLFSFLPAVSGIYLMHSVCYSLYFYGGKFAIMRKINSDLAKIGTLTLEIYLLHYIILHYIKISSSQFILFGKSVCDTIFEFPIYITLSILIAISCIMIVIILKWIGVCKFIFPRKDLINILTARINKTVSYER